MARSYRRDARGRFAGGGYSGQTGGRGARLKGGGAKRAGGGAAGKAAKRATPSGAIRGTDVRQARISNAISKNIERRNKAGLNPPTAAKENQAARIARAERTVAVRAGKPQGLNPGGTKAKTKPSRPAMGQREIDRLNSAKSYLAMQKQSLQSANKRKKTAAGPIEKLKAQSKVSEAQLKVRSATNTLTRIQARPVLGRPISGVGRYSQATRAKKRQLAGGIRGTVKRDQSVASKVKSRIDINAGKLKNVYINNANMAARRRR